MRRRGCVIRTALASVVVAAVLLVAGEAVAQAATLRRCGTSTRVLCGHVVVPLDRSGTLPGSVSLSVRLIRATRANRGTVLFLSGGPGQGSTPFTALLADPRTSPLGPLVATHDILLLDQRGTGVSGPLRCPALEAGNLLYVSVVEAATCAARLGPARDFYETRDSADDLEAVRTAVGAPPLTVYGVSYGTKVALEYARRHPAGVSRLVLDSVVGPGGPDTYYRDSIAAVPRVLRDLCSGACRSFAPDPVSDVAALVGRIGSAPLSGYFVGVDGRRHPSELDGFGLLNVLIAGDLSPPHVDAEIPAALRSAVSGDTAPLMRLARIARIVNGAPGRPPEFSPALNLATVCSEFQLPWSRSTPVTDRLAQAQDQVAKLGQAAFAPFDEQTALNSDVVRSCLGWPSPARAPDDSHQPLPDVPALLLDGVDDLRTPLEGAQATARDLPRAQLVAVSATGHDTLDSDVSGCSKRALARFFAGQAAGTCPPRRRVLYPTPPAPRSVASLPAARGAAGASGRTLCAVAQTVADADLHLSDGLLVPNAPHIFRVPGLRDGVALVRILAPGRVSLAFAGYSYVPGVALTGAVRGALRVSGPAAVAGSVRVRPTGLLTGTLGGRPVRAGVRSCLQSQVAAILFGPRPAARKAMAAAAVHLRVR